MLQLNVNDRATRYLNGLRRIEKIPDKELSFDDHVLLFPEHADLFYTSNHVIVTSGLGKESDSKQQDLLTHIEIRDPLNADYAETKILMPRIYAESLNPIPYHISVQAIVYSQVTEQDKNKVLEMISHTDYNKTSYDKMWIENNDPNENLRPGQPVVLMNRRIGGWDGSPDRPVIELLGSGGHLPTIWNDGMQTFQQMDPIDAVIGEFHQELGHSLSPSDVDIIGGFHNLTTNELVVLCSALVPFPKIVDIQNGALGNFKENIDGIYLGTFKGTMALYLENAEPYAGGEKTKMSNFPSQPELMKRIYRKLGI
jgi:hypothetical protein